MRIVRDLQHAWRMMWRSPGFTAVVLVTLAVAIGANTALFSVVDGVLLQPLPYTNPERLVRVHSTHAKLIEAPVSPADFEEFRAHNSTFENLALLQFFEHEYAGSKGAEQLRGYYISRGYFEMLGYRPLLGQSFAEGRSSTDESIAPVGPETVIVSHDFWRNRLGSDPNIVGRTLNLSRRPFLIVGIMPEGLRHVGDPLSLHGDSVDFWLPTVLQPGRLSRQFRMFEVIGKLKPGVSTEQAQADLSQIAARLERDFPDTNARWRPIVRPLKEEIVGKAEPLLLASFGAAGFVLLIACANLACLLLARSMARSREYALRTALGAERLQLLRLSLFEALLLAIGGGLLGLPLAIAGVQVLLNLAPENLPRRDMIGVDAGMLLFAALLTPLVGFLFGLLPAIRSTQTAPAEELHAGGRTVSASSLRLYEVLVACELALCLVVLTGAGLLARTFYNLKQLPLGVETTGALVATVDIPGNIYGLPEKRRDFYANFLRDVRSQPGVMHAGISTFRPFAPNVGLAMNAVGTAFEVVGRPTAPNDAPRARFHAASPGYFEAIGASLVEGRWFDDRDKEDTPFAVIVNQTLAKRFFPGENPVGRSLRFRTQMAQIVGVVGDIKDSPASLRGEPHVFAPYARLPAFRMTAAVKMRGDALAAMTPMRKALTKLDANVPFFGIRTLKEISESAIATQRFAALLFGTFAAVSLLLAIVGAYGVMAFLTGRRRKEFAIRQALGAQSREIIAMVLRRALAIVVAGVAVGLFASTLLARAVESYLFGVSANDWLTRGLAALLLTAVILYAAAVPVMRAAKMDPGATLKAE